MAIQIRDEQMEEDETTIPDTKPPSLTDGTWTTTMPSGWFDVQPPLSARQ